MQLATGHEFHTETKFLLQIIFAPGLEHIFKYYITEKLTIPLILGMQWL